MKNSTDIVRILTDAQNEITRLRRTCEILGAKVETFEACMTLVYTKPPDFSCPASVDVVYELSNAKDKIIEAGL